MWNGDSLLLRKGDNEQQSSHAILLLNPKRLFLEVFPFFLSWNAGKFKWLDGKKSTLPFLLNAKKHRLFIETAKTRASYQRDIIRWRRTHLASEWRESGVHAARGGPVALDRGAVRACRVWLDGFLRGASRASSVVCADTCNLLTPDCGRQRKKVTKPDTKHCIVVRTEIKKTHRSSLLYKFFGKKRTSKSKIRVLIRAAVESSRSKTKSVVAWLYPEQSDFRASEARAS